MAESVKQKTEAPSLFSTVVSWFKAEQKTEKPKETKKQAEEPNTAEMIREVLYTIDQIN